MMENRSFDHMLGSLRAHDQRIDGVTGKESNPDSQNETIKVAPKAEFQSQLDPDPGHHYPDVDIQLFNGSQDRSKPNMQGFIRAYYEQRQDVDHSHKIMYYFKNEDVPVISTLARKYAVFNRWFSSIPGPTIPNRAFAHFGTSFGKVDMDVFYLGEKYLSVYERMVNAGQSAKIYYYDQQSSTIGAAFLLKNQPQIFGTYEDFLAACEAGKLPQYSFIEPNFTDHDGPGGAKLASDQHPDHNVRAGELFIASIYNAIRSSPVWENTAFLIVYDEHGGIYDHVPPPACTPDEFKDQSTGFMFDRLGVRVPAVLISPWVPEGTVISPLNGNGEVDDLRVFEHASIPNTVTNFFLKTYDARTEREKKSLTFLDVLSLPAPRKDFFEFSTGAPAAVAHAAAPHAMAPHAMGARPAAAPAKQTIHIEEPPADAMNAERPISGLIRDQIEHLHKAELAMLPPEEQTGVDVHSLRTEADASQYIEQVTAKLHVRAAGAPGR